MPPDILARMQRSDSPLRVPAHATEEPASSLAGVAYDRLREAIVRGDLRPHQRLVETQLAELLELSRTPIREALGRLTADGLVTSHRRGWVVRDYTPEEVAEIHEVRAALEGMAVYLACERGSDEAIDEIVAFHHQQNRENLATPPSDYLVEYNDAFHEAVVAASGNRRLEHFVRRNREFFFTYRIARLYSEDEARASLAGHDEIVEALKARDAERGERAMRRHILEARDVIIRKLG
jgi:DNA-binding GntR family transcriptional regulator